MKSLLPRTRLYGRDSDAGKLIDRLQHISSGYGEVVLVPGASGVGKTALVSELETPTRNRNGIFARGKFDQFRRHVPYSAFRQALAELCRELQAGDARQRARFRDDIRLALGDQGQLLVDLVPEYEAFLGSQPSLVDISPQEARHRFARVVRDFLKVVCRPEHPLVLFIDDWQWADAASFELLKQLEVGTTLPYLLVIASYRDDEVGQGHELLSTVDELRGRGVQVETLQLHSITPHAVNEFVADTLRSTPEGVAGLAQLVHDRTSGNPFFMRSFLGLLEELDLVAYEEESASWIWSLDTIRGADLPQSIVELFAMKLRRLSRESQRLLALAACMGNRFDIETLSLIDDLPAEECLAVAQTALSEDVLVQASDGGGTTTQAGSVAELTFAFRHDRLQQAAYSLIAPAELPATLLRIGRLLRASLSPEQLSERLFEVVGNMNAGEKLIHQLDEQVDLVELNAAAARKAYAATAYGSALDFYRTGCRVMARPEVSGRLWPHRHDLGMVLLKGRAECEFLVGDIAEGEACVQLAVARAPTAVAKADVLCTLIVHYTLRSRYPDAIATGRQALAALGITLPEDGFEQACRAEIAAVRRGLAGRPVASLFDLPDMNDPVMLMAAKILITMGPPCYRSHQRLWSVIVPKVVAMTLEHGNIAQSGYSHTAFGGLLGWMDGDYTTAKEFGDLATRLMTSTFRTSSDQSVFYLMIGSSVRHWFEHLRFGSQDYRDAYEMGQRSSNLQYAAYAFGHDMYCRFYQGAPLNQLVMEAKRSLAFSRTRHNQWAIDLLEGGLSLFRPLLGEAPGPGTGERSEEEYLAGVEEHSNVQVTCIYNVLQTFCHLLAGDLHRALELSDETEPLLYTVGTQGLLPWPEHEFARALIHTALYPSAEPDRQEAWRESLGEVHEKLRVWAGNCPENYEHKYLLLSAELAKNDGRHADAIQLYDEAVAAASAGGFVQWEGIANERASTFWQEQGADRFAQAYWQQAYVCYDRWGARQKVLAMEADYRTHLTGNLHGDAAGTKGLGHDVREHLVQRQIDQLRELAAQQRVVERHLESVTRAEELDLAMKRLRTESAALKQSEEPARHMARHDALTKLPNRRFLDERLAETIAANDRRGRSGAVLFLDLDNFKPLNDTWGHAAGDLLLISVARRFESCLRETDTVARIGGDEFVVLIGGLGANGSDPTHPATVLAEKIRATLAEPYLLPAQGQAGEPIEHRCTASIGVSIFAGAEGAAGEEILHQADQAMYQAKQAGGNAVRVFSAPAMRSPAT